MNQKTSVAILTFTLLISMFALFNQTNPTASADNTNTYPCNWSMFHANPAHTGYSPSTNVPLTNQTLWVFNSTIDRFWQPASVVDGYVYIGSNQYGDVYCLAADTGVKQWSTDLTGAISSEPAVQNGIVYVGFVGGIAALNASTGQIMWIFPVYVNTCSSPIIVDGVLYTGSGDNNVYAIDALTGQKIWNYTTGSWIFSSPAVVGGMVFIGSYDGYLYALSASTGNLIWRYKADQYIYSSPTVSDGIVYFGSSPSNNFYALNAATGQKIWQFYPVGDVHSSPCITNGVVYFGSDDGYQYALSAANGSTLWSKNIGGWIDCAPAYADGVLYTTIRTGHVMAFNGTDGTELWRYDTNDTMISSPTIANSVLYVGSNNSCVYAFGTYSNPSSPIASPTPSPIILPTSSPTTSPTKSPTTTPSPTDLPVDELPTPTLSLSCTGSVSPSIINVEISGCLTSEGVGLADKAISISYLPAGTTSWQTLTGITTGSDGTFAVQWLPTATGNYQIRASYSGDASYPSISTSANLVILPYTPSDDGDVFSVTSNSTVTNLVFNSTSYELSFTVSGESNTTGYVDMYIAKSLVEDISGLKIYVSQDQVNFNAVSEQDAWFIHFTYHHSTHPVVLNFAGDIANGATANEPVTIPVIIGAFVAVAVVLAIAIKKRKN